MPRRKKVRSPMGDLYERVPSIQVGNRLIEQGEIIKIHGVWGTKFRFLQHTKRTDTGTEWIDCIELEKGTPCGQRSFYPERVKPLPRKRGKRKKKS